MQVRIIFPNTRIPGWKRDFLDAGVRRALVRFAQQVNCVEVCFSDLNGPRGGVDTQCRMRLLMRPRGEINVSAVALSANSALRSAIQRAKRHLRTSTLDRRPNADDGELGLRGFLLRLGW